MRLLALDTATEHCSAALLINDQVLVREALLERGHAEHILPMVQQLLAEGGIGLRALDALAFGRGPGAFTGVRLAASVAQGLAFGADLRVVPVSNLAALAQRALLEDPTAAAVLVCTDARMREVYCGAFTRTRHAGPAPAAPEGVLAPERVALPPGWNPAQTVGAGSGFAAYAQLRALLPGVRVREGLWPRAREIAALATLEVRAGRTLPAVEAVPVYLRDDVARSSA